MNINTADLQAITSVDVVGWREAVPQIRDHYSAFGDRLPNELATALDALENSLRYTHPLQGLQLTTS
jgi:phosphoenolpyruvate carboxykinase (GTP)